jgi:hypothetical protein
MKGLTYRISVLAVAALLAGLSGCNDDDSHDSITPPPPPETGVVSAGVITGFGSVYLNGVRYDTSAAQVSVNGEAAVEADLKVGQYVQLQGHAHGTTHYADVIRYHNVLEGPITAIDLDADSFVALGQNVLVTSLTSLGDEIMPSSIEGLAVGDVVEVSGLVSSTDVIEATRVDIKPDGGPYDVTGYVSNPLPATKRFNINALVVDYSTANMEDFATGEPAAGDLVLVKGSTFNTDGSFVAIHVELRSDDWIKPDAGDELEIEGLITDFVSAADFKVAGAPVTTTPTTLYEHGTADDLANDVLVEVEGTADAAGVLVALKVKFKEINEIRIVAPIDALTAADGTMTLLGLVVSTDEGTRYEDMSTAALRDLGFGDLVVGNWVDVRGYEEPAGSNAVTATRVVRIDPADDVRLRGPFLTPEDKPNFHILSVPVVTSDTTRFVLEEGIRLTVDEFFTQAPGEIVEAWGDWGYGLLGATRVEIKVNDD